MLSNSYLTLYFIFIFWPLHVACGILVPRPGIKPILPWIRTWNPNHWTAREVPGTVFFIVWPQKRQAISFAPFCLFDVSQEVIGLTCTQQMGGNHARAWTPGGIILKAAPHMDGSSLVAQSVKRLPATQETWLQSLSREDPLEKEMATHFSLLARRTPWTEELGSYSLRGRSQRVGYDWVTVTFTFASHKDGLQRALEPISGPFFWLPQEIKAKLTQTGHLKEFCVQKAGVSSMTSQSPNNIVPDQPGLWPQTNLGSNTSPVLPSYELSSILTSFPPLRNNFLLWGNNFLLRKKTRLEGLPW